MWARSYDGTIRTTFWIDGSWYVGSSMGSRRFASKPAATSTGGGVALVAVRGYDGVIYSTRSMHTTAPAVWSPIPGSGFTYAPAITYYDGKVIVAAVKDDGKLYWTRNTIFYDAQGRVDFNPSTWSGWTRFAGEMTFTSEPALSTALASNGISYVTWIVARGRTRKLYFTAWGAEPLPEHQLNDFYVTSSNGQTFSSGPAVYVGGPGGNTVVVGARTDEGNYKIMGTSNVTLGGLYNASPALTLLGTRLVAVGPRTSERITDTWITP